MEKSRWTFRPRRVLFERAALDYELGRRLWDRFTDRPAGKGQDRAGVAVIASHNRVTGLPGRTPAEAYQEAKRTLVVGVRKGLDLTPCRPSADYQLPLVTSCPGLCEYCYLQTTLGRRPYVRVYVNLDEILAKAGELSAAGSSRPVSFEGAAVGDPVPTEPLTGALASAVSYFGRLDNGRFRFVTKFPDIDSLVGLDHREHTRARVTVNPESVIQAYDRGTPGLEMRLDTLTRLAAAGYPVGVMAAPVFLEGDWREDYEELFTRLAAALARAKDVTIEVVTHRFTGAARRVILERYPESRLPMGEEGRRHKRGQFGYFKYVYPEDLVAEAGDFFTTLAGRHLPAARFDYTV